MEERQVYVSFESENYKSNKAELLKCKIDLINLQKSITRLAAIRSAKKRLIAQILQQISSASFVISRLDNKMPDTSLPKHIKDKMPKPQKHKVAKQLKEKIIPEKQPDLSHLDQELIALNKRIKELS
jgi:DNA-binding FrmR family transcriptional regulator